MCGCRLRHLAARGLNWDDPVAAAFGDIDEDNEDDEDDESDGGYHDPCLGWIDFDDEEFEELIAEFEEEIFEEIEEYEEEEYEDEDYDEVTIESVNSEFSVD